jgi:hypothetical protein
VQGINEVAVLLVAQVGVHVRGAHTGEDLVGVILSGNSIKTLTRSS